MAEYVYSRNMSSLKDKDWFALVKILLFVFAVTFAILFIEDADNPLLYFCEGAFVMWWLKKIEVL